MDKAKMQGYTPEALAGLYKNTGIYSLELNCFLQDQGIWQCLENAFQIKHSMGIVRNKNDKADSKAIVLYAYHFCDKLKQYVLPGKTLQRLHFRPNKSAHDCILQAQTYIHEGYRHIVDIDPKSFFDEVDHCLLYRKVKCPLTLRLIRKWLRAPILTSGKLTKRRKGVPQGSPLSPVLSNIMLHELDTELQKRGLRFVRYADDFSIYTKSKYEAQKTEKTVTLFLKEKLKLVVNAEKSSIRKPVQFKILGYRFVSTYEKGVKGKYQLVVCDKSWDKLKENLKTITRKTIPMSMVVRIRKLREVGRGWVNYFRMASIHGKLKEVDSWIRKRLHYCIWHHWKKPERRRKNLMRLGVNYALARVWSRTRMGGWAVAQRPILNTTITWTG